jgi:hypothetical protein
LTKPGVFGIDSYSAMVKASLKEAEMPGDPRECRQHALNCMLMAKGAQTPEARDHFAKLARSWIRLAEDLEQNQAFLAALDDEAEPERQTG